ncbi:MAG: aminoacyl-tRNA hydrolase [Rickettsiales bacterium]|nr:aminoacyl-tRNA hydrolase [Rickettsiales bacterium]
MFLIVGLGNPGDEYKNNRHNIGFKFIDYLLESSSNTKIQKKFNAIIAKIVLNDREVILLKPQNYMNNSGLAVKEASHFFKIKSENIIVIHDELDLKFNEIKTKFSGGSAGHNGLKDIDKHIGNNYHRIRIGIDHPRNLENSNIEVANYVLQNFNLNESKLIEDILHKSQIELNKILNSS